MVSCTIVHFSSTITALWLGPSLTEGANLRVAEEGDRVSFPMLALNVCLPFRDLSIRKLPDSAERIDAQVSQPYQIKRLSSGSQVNTMKGA